MANDAHSQQLLQAARSVRQAWRRRDGSDVARPITAAQDVTRGVEGVFALQADDAPRASTELAKQRAA